MAIIGDICEFSISDMIQMIHNTRKSGNYRISSTKGECNLVFSKGEIVSANYLNDLVRIGQVLVRLGAITKAELSWALTIQEQDLTHRKPLVLTLLENRMLDKESAYTGLKMLIEMTLVEILSWDAGEFFFEECTTDKLDGWQMYLDIHQEVSLNAQAVLLESLRIFDEKRRDGTMGNILSIVGLDSNHSLLLDTSRFKEASDVLSIDFEK